MQQRRKIFLRKKIQRINRDGVLAYKGDDENQYQDYLFFKSKLEENRKYNNNEKNNGYKEFHKMIIDKPLNANFEFYPPQIDLYTTLLNVDMTHFINSVQKYLFFEIPNVSIQFHTFPIEKYENCYQKLMDFQEKARNRTRIILDFGSCDKEKYKDLNIADVSHLISIYPNNHYSTVLRNDGKLSLSVEIVSNLSKTNFELVKLFIEDVILDIALYHSFPNLSNCVSLIDEDFNKLKTNYIIKNNLTSNIFDSIEGASYFPLSNTCRMENGELNVPKLINIWSDFIVSMFDYNYREKYIIPEYNRFKPFHNTTNIDLLNISGLSIDQQLKNYKYHKQMGKRLINKIKKLEKGDYVIIKRKHRKNWKNKRFDSFYKGILSMGKIEVKEIGYIHSIRDKLEMYELFFLEVNND